MSETFHGRKSELDSLNFLLHKKASSLVVIRGRRRIVDILQRLKNVGFWLQTIFA
jgi:hypothetical protein